MTHSTFPIVCLSLACTLIPPATFGQTDVRPPGTDGPLLLYPSTYSRAPDLASPGFVDGVELLVVHTKDGREAVVPVTVENSCVRFPYGSSDVGKGRQLEVDSTDFPTLARTGLHSEAELGRTTEITGKPVADITRMGRPSEASSWGFLAGDETIVSVLKGDDRLVRQLGLTHPQLARPLFHIWNMLLQEHEHGGLGRHSNDIVSFLYNGKTVLVRAHPTRGFQESIFNDGIRGAFDITLRRDLEPSETAYIAKKYGHLDPASIDALVKGLSTLRTGEMQPYYVMRYGFYEGHTGWRVDPIAIAFIFGMRTLGELDEGFRGELNRALAGHFTSK